MKPLPELQGGQSVSVPTIHHALRLMVGMA
jgi:hypothetical protein